MNKEIKQNHDKIIFEFDINIISIVAYRFEYIDINS